MSDLSLRSVTKVFYRKDGEEVHAIDNVSLDIKQGEFIVLLGPSGCGKTTLLRSVAGLEYPSSGSISIGGVDVFNSSRRISLPPETRRLGMVFQSYALWPHLSVADNIAYPLQMEGLRRAAVTSRVTEILEAMQIEHLSKQFPSQISGGQQQRVALARALVRGDSLILFDEPLSNVDAKVREHLRVELLAMQRKLGFTALYVTHDQHEAMGLATKIAVVANGRIAQIDTPERIYRQPKSLEVAEFVGSINKISGRLSSSGDCIRIKTKHGSIPVSPEAVAGRKEQEVFAISRPEDWSVSTETPVSEESWRGEIVASVFLGAHTEYIVRFGELNIVIWKHKGELLPPGQSVWCNVKPESVALFDQG
ncbi:ABC transporter ATP-binding protein [Chelativorans sp. Marseille-P2723]|uniref:ABC transporter ATP-binding protein n=1 Tax=Chelativorans sp. Marseille-P2723 TaxID=2709133 RepID=UPI00156DE3B5|nr:ABC transporter ATP-binding protein [Chelativorans sp. Marseille-P2723]